MVRSDGGGVRSVVEWTLFPLAPAILGRAYHQSVGGLFFQRDPRMWTWLTWLLMLGPLLGYGFLAGATLRLPDDPDLRGFRAWTSRRAFCVGVGPWVGFLLGAAVFYLLEALEYVAARLHTPDPSQNSSWSSLAPPWLNTVAFWTAFVLIVATIGYGWLVVAFGVVRRAKRLGRAWRTFEQGLAVALGFVGSLFGSFWAITEAWRSYFFDPRIIPVILAVSGLLLSSGCASQESYGDVRRRDLFAAMLTAWLLGLAFAWRWWSRRPR